MPAYGKPSQVGTNRQQPYGSVSEELLFWCGALTCIFNAFEHLLYDLRVQTRTRWNGTATLKARRQQCTFCFARRPPRKLRQCLDSRGQDLTAEQNIPLIRWQGVEIQLDGFLDVRGCLFKRVALRLASLEFWAPRLRTVLILLDHDACLFGHGFSVALQCGGAIGVCRS